MPKPSREKDKAEEKVIKIPPRIVEALLYANATGNRSATTEVCSDIRKLAIEQGFEKF